VSDRPRIIWDPEFVDYDFGVGHPMTPVRLDLTIRLATELGLLDNPEHIVAPEGMASDDDLLRVHTPALLFAVRRAGEDPRYPALDHGVGTDDVPAFVGMHEASAMAVGATLTAARLVASGEADHAVNIAGGLHHALPDRASGFCVYNDVAVGIHWLLDHGFERVAYVDIDVHHGDGVQAIFWDDPRVLTISMHETGQTLFPGTGFPDEIGGPHAKGSAVNIALPAGTTDSGWLRAFNAVVPPLIEEFKPQVIVSQHGADSHVDDPLAHLAITVDGQRAAAAAIHRLAHRHAGGRWIALGGGGYEWACVVPRAWSHVIGIALGNPVDPQTLVPQGFRDHLLATYQRVSPTEMGDGAYPWAKSFDDGYDPSNGVDRSIMATREAVFPHHGLLIDPWQLF
jgi:acetoin utilization protein AcuC